MAGPDLTFSDPLDVLAVPVVPEMDLTVNSISVDDGAVVVVAVVLEDGFVVLGFVVVVFFVVVAFVVVGVTFAATTLFLVVAVVALDEEAVLEVETYFEDTYATFLPTFVLYQ